MLIKELELYTSQLQEQLKFYANTLGLSIVDQSSSSASFKIGHSLLRFTETETTTPYHYAINIPSNQENEALKWLSERVNILKDQSNQIQYFDFWDAYAIYFYDTDHNIVEFIARRNLNKPSKNPFSSQSLIGISEMGVPTDSIPRDYSVLYESTGIDIHSGNTERFCAIGDEAGLFIMINSRLKKEWYPTEDKPYRSDFKVTFTEKDIEYFLACKDKKLTIQSA